MLDNFVKTCSCNWENEENCIKCACIEDLSYALKERPNCNVFALFKFKTITGDDNWRWDAIKLRDSIEEYIEEDLPGDIAYVKYMRSERERNEKNE